jgi:hypothetical protein
MNTDVIKFNRDEQIKSRIDFCNVKPSSQICTNVGKNTYDNWVKYYSDDKNIFSKGTSRLNEWNKLLLLEENNSIISKLKELKSYDKTKYFFVMAALITIFQVFGDANHRTSKYFYTKMTGLNMTPYQESKIDEILRSFDYNSLTSDKLIQIIDKLTQDTQGTQSVRIGTQSVRGGKKKRRKRTKKNRRRHK